MGLRLWQNVFLDMNGFSVLHFIHSIRYSLSFRQMFSSIGQSPCDVAVELASVCYDTRMFAFLSIWSLLLN
jgi:hypothetical protein